MRPVVWSFGGGTQSVAIAVLVVEGKLPRPERIVIADTSREASETWEYMELHVGPYLKAAGLEVEIAPHSLSTVGLYAGNGDLLIPAFTHPKGKLHTFCSDKWKQRPVRRWMRAQGYGPKKPIRQWLGISVDEIHRAKDADVGWVEHHFPLLYDEPTRRHECVALVEAAGLPSPPRSSCWMCPHRTNEEWRWLRDHYPEDWGNALALERRIRKKDPGLFLHRDRIPLRIAEIAEIDDDPNQTSFFAECDSGFCFV